MRNRLIVFTGLFLIICLITLFPTTALQAQGPSRTFIYVNNNDFDNSISAFNSTDTGQLQSISGSPYATGGIGGKKSGIGGICVCKKARLLFATNNADDTVSGFRINSNGSLTRLPNSPVATGGRFAAGVACNKQGTRIFVANVGSDSISAFNVDSAGNLQPVAGSPFPGGNGPIDLTLNKNGTLLFASQQFSHTVAAYQVDSNGRLRLINQIVTPGLTNHGFNLNFATSRIYVAELGNNSISGFNVDLNSGAFAPLPNLPYFTDGSEPIAIATNKQGNLIFASNNSNATISVFTANSDGSLRALSGSPFSADSVGPAGMVVNKRGSLLYVVNGGFASTSSISVYQISSSGEIAAVAGSPFTTGTFSVPAAIAILELK